MTAEPLTAKHRASALWAQSDYLRVSARRKRADADALERAANRLATFATAIADGREEDIAAIAQEMARDR